MNDTIENGTGLSFEQVVWHDENLREVSVTSHYLLNILRRLRSLEEISPEHLSESDIPATLAYIKTCYLTK